jgi:transposase
MARALSLDLRKRVVEAVAKGMSCRQAAVRFGVSASSATRWATQVRSGGSLVPIKQGGDRRSHHIEAAAAFILGAVAEQPDMTLAELQEKLNERGKSAGSGPFGVSSSATGLHSKKDCARRRAGESGREGRSRSPDRGADRSQPGKAHLHRRDRGNNENGAPLRPGATRRALPGSGAIWSLEDGDLHGGATGRRPLAPMILDGPLDGDAFRAYVTQVLVP